MTIKDMPHVTVEQVLALRDAAIKIEKERDELAAQAERLRNDLGKCVSDLKAQWQAEATDRFFHCLFYAPSSPAGPRLAVAIKEWWPEFCESRNEKEKYAQEASNGNTCR